MYEQSSRYTQTVFLRAETQTFKPYVTPRGARTISKSLNAAGRPYLRTFTVALSAAFNAARGANTSRPANRFPFGFLIPGTKRRWLQFVIAPEQKARC